MSNLILQNLCESNRIVSLFWWRESFTNEFLVSLITFFHLPNPPKQPFSTSMTPVPTLSNNNPVKLAALLRKRDGEFITNKEAFN